MNYFGSQGLSHLCEVLKINRSIEKLILHSNHFFDEESLEKLFDALKLNQKIKIVDVVDSYDDEIFPDTEKIINRIIKENQSIIQIQNHFQNQNLSSNFRNDLFFHFQVESVNESI